MIKVEVVMTGQYSTTIGFKNLPFPGDTVYAHDTKEGVLGFKVDHYHHVTYPDGSQFTTLYARPLT